MTGYDPQCFGKDPFPTHAAALRRIKLQAKRRGKKGSVGGHKGPWSHACLTAYQCRSCSKWHVGHGGIGERHRR